MDRDFHRRMGKALFAAALASGAVGAGVMVAVAAHQTPSRPSTASRAVPTTQVSAPSPRDLAVTAPSVSPATVPAVAAAVTPASTPPPAPDPVAGWKRIANNAGGYSFRVPAAWAISGPCADAGQASGDPLLQEVRTGPTASHCGTDLGGNIEAFSYRGSKDLFDLNQPDFTKSVSTVTVDGVQGTRTVMTPNVAGSYSSSVTYVFIHKGRIYEVSDQINPADPVNGTPASPDLTSTLDTIMSRTWHFAA